MRILEVCPFSAGICGVWSRVEEEAKGLSERDHELMIFSSNKTKGSDEIASKNQKIGKISIKRFRTFKLGGESFMYFSYHKEAISYKPDIIIAHNYRHLHTLLALRVAYNLRKQGHTCKVFLVTHAPFVEGNITRTWWQSTIVKLYDCIIAPLTLPLFDAILPIALWEIPYLCNIGARKKQLKYIPNGIPDIFFTQKKSAEKNHIIFLGRISPKKKLDTLIKAVASLNQNNKTFLHIIGPQEKEYFESLKKLTASLHMDKYIKFIPPVHGLKEKIRILDNAKMFVLPSRVEGMPQALIEAMAREKIVIGSNSIAIRELIKDNQDGYLFEFDNPTDLARVIKKAINKPSSQIKKAARKKVELFAWDKVITRLEKVLNVAYNKY
ncbi:glycosyltransferase family 4 protein [Candidatus Pacearchaeota archaeon]|nr:glycosyltransferase family 4 protein [Candidatus Pacearchaeota archaeon]